MKEAQAGVLESAGRVLSGLVAVTALLPVSAVDWRARRVTGDVLDALELPRAAGMLAVSLWLYSRGRADEILRLPALPHPARPGFPGCWSSPRKPRYR